MTASTPLRRGWTTGCCATAAASAAWSTLVTGICPDPVTITLPRGQKVDFSLDSHGRNATTAWACVVKDAGDDPDVTHGAHVRAFVRRLPSGSGIVFRAGEGVGTVTRPGLPIPPGEPAINPVPRSMIREALRAVSGHEPDAEVSIAIDNGEVLARRTLNGRLGIVGGLSVLGTTGIVVPFSCAAWIDSIRRGIDVARAMNVPHIAGSTGNTSERAIQKLYDLPDVALIEMGDFAGGMLKYLRRHPVSRVTIAGGIAKMAKLAQGHLDLHSGRGLASPSALADMGAELDLALPVLDAMRQATTVAQAFKLACNPRLGHLVATRAQAIARTICDVPGCTVDVVVFDRDGQPVGRSDSAA